MYWVSLLRLNHFPGTTIVPRDRVHNGMALTYYFINNLKYIPVSVFLYLVTETYVISGSQYIKLRLVKGTIRTEIYPNGVNANKPFAKVIFTGKDKKAT